MARPARRAKSAREWGPDGSELGGCGVGRYVPRGARYAASTMRPMAHAQHASSRAVAQLATTDLLPESSSADLRSTSLLTPFAAWRLTSGATSWPLLSDFSRLDAPG